MNESPEREDELQERLRKHVDVLAEPIGERNTLRPSALDAARTYLERTLTAIGYRVDPHPHPVSGRMASFPISRR